MVRVSKIGIAREKHVKFVMILGIYLYLYHFKSLNVECKDCLTGYGCVKSEGLQAGELLAPGLLHAVTEDAFPGVQLQQLDAPQQFIGLL